MEVHVERALVWCFTPTSTPRRSRPWACPQASFGFLDTEKNNVLSKCTPVAGMVSGDKRVRRVSESG